MDGSVPGAAATYSHWRDAPEPPPGLAADTSTEMTLKAAADAGRWLDPYHVVCNNHIDADGLLSLAIACRPEVAIPHARLLIGAAEAGDFSSWPGREPFRLMLRLHQLIRDEQARGIGWEQRSCTAVVDDLVVLIAESAQPDRERDSQVRRVEDTIARLANRDGFSIDTYGRIAVVTWKRRHGHRSDSFLTVDDDDDLPPWAIGCAVPEHLFQLLAMETPDGTVYQLDAPRYSWARVVNLPHVPWPDLSDVRDRLQAAESGSCRWVDRPVSARLGFVCQLASAQGDTTAPSALAAAHVVYACRSALDASAV
ncbi:MAG: hypothetical protein H0V44_09300 [Planctomycetes bacterium]|nr:hypothetical protein [Planctomycetota bacterium]